MVKLLVDYFWRGRKLLPIKGGVAMYDPTFTKFRLYASGGEATSTPLEAQDTDHILTVDTDQEIQVRMFVQNLQASGSTDDWIIAADKNISAFVVVPVADTGAGIETAGAGLTNDVATTNRATNGITDGTGSFDAAVQITDGDGSVTLNASNYTEVVFGIKFIAANVANNDTFDFEFNKPNAMDNNIVPRITISKAAGGATVPLMFDHLSMGHQ